LRASRWYRDSKIRRRLFHCHPCHEPLTDSGLSAREAENTAQEFCRGLVRQAGYSDENGRQRPVQAT
jgi:hypothetical protein